MEWTKAPEVPVIVTVADPVVAVLLAVSVTTLVPVVGLVPNAAVTPLGRPLALNVVENFANLLGQELMMI